jgi:hypothetical protein
LEWDIVAAAEMIRKQFLYRQKNAVANATAFLLLE